MTRRVYNKIYDPAIWEKVNPQNKELLEDFLLDLRESKRSSETINDGTLLWLLGCSGHDPIAPATAYNFSTSGAGSKMWLDSCTSADGTVADLLTDTGGIGYMRNMTPASPVVSGTFYDY